jgi:hypothetical protein
VLPLGVGEGRADDVLLDAVEIAAQVGEGLSAAEEGVSLSSVSRRSCNSEDVVAPWW